MQAVEAPAKRSVRKTRAVIIAAAIVLLAISACGGKPKAPEEQAAPSEPEPPVSPVVGYWHEVGRFPCDGGPEFVPEDPIRDFHISIRSFELTWRPFESYVDYIGKYTVDDERKTITFEGLNGNYVPDDVDPSGTYEIDGDTLVLRDMWLGASKRGKGTSGCGHRFR